MVPSSLITIIADDERLACGGLSLDEPIFLGNMEFIIDYFSGSSLSPRRGNEGVIFVGSTHSGTSTPQWLVVKDSTEHFLTVSSGQGSFDNPSPRRKGSAPGMTRFPPWIVVHGRKPATPQSSINLTTKDN
jgi:hypothetical protein